MNKRHYKIIWIIAVAFVFTVISSILYKCNRTIIHENKIEIIHSDNTIDTVNHKTTSYSEDFLEFQIIYTDLSYKVGARYPIIARKVKRFNILETNIYEK
jgi:hypothetical protein